MQHFVDFVTQREAPEHVVRRLRSVDPTAELLWWGPRAVEVDVGNGRPIMLSLPVWLLGTVKQNGYRRRVGAQLIESQEKLGPRGNRDTWRYARLLYQGFAPVTFYPFRDPTEAIARDFEKRNWLFLHRFNEECERALDESEGLPHLEMRQQRIRDYVGGEGAALWKFAFAKRRSFAAN